MQALFRMFGPRNVPSPSTPQPSTLAGQVLATLVPILESRSKLCTALLAIVVFSIVTRIRELRLRQQAQQRHHIFEAQRRKIASKATYSIDDLRKWDGRNGGPVLICLAGEGERAFSPSCAALPVGYICFAPRVCGCSCTVYDVSDGLEFYGQNGCYRSLVGCDATRLLAKGLLQPEPPEEALMPLTQTEEHVLDEWRAHYAAKYRKLGTLKTADSISRCNLEGSNEWRVVSPTT